MWNIKIKHDLYFIFTFLVAEGIDDLETFLELKEQDFIRLKLKTKIIKTIERIQKELTNEFIIEERLNETTESESFNAFEVKNTSYIIEDDTSESNPYKAIYLDKVSLK